MLSLSFLDGNSYGCVKVYFVNIKIPKLLFLTDGKWFKEIVTNSWNTYMMIEFLSLQKSSSWEFYLFIVNKQQSYKHFKQFYAA